ncbi:MAG TPA: DsrE/DsrF/DrsH-like family protein [Stenomitos sp.]
MIDAKPQELAALVEQLSRLEGRMNALEERVDTELSEIRENLPADRAAIVLFSGDLDRVLAAFIIATGAATMGLEVSMFFTFWGLGAVKERRELDGKNLAERMMTLMTPGNTLGLTPSKMAFFGAGAVMLRQMMRDKDVSSLEDLQALAQELGVKFVACEMSMDVMGIKQSELRADCELGGVATFLGDAIGSKLSLFI